MKTEICQHGNDITNRTTPNGTPACPEGCLSNDQRANENRQLCEQLRETEIALHTVRSELSRCGNIAQRLDVTGPDAPLAFSGTIAERLQRHVDRLLAWKESSKSLWDELQLTTLAKVLEIPLGVSIPSAILPKVLSLKSEQDIHKDTLAVAITPRDAVRILNEANKLDPRAIYRLCCGDHRVPCNEPLALHHSIQASDHLSNISGVQRETTGCYSVGLLGVINGLFGIDSQGYGPIFMQYDSKRRCIAGFCVRKDWSRVPPKVGGTR